MITTKVLFFADGGVDDSFALLYALASEQIEVVGVVADYGNMPREVAVRNVRHLLQKAGHAEIPVISGAARPLSGEEPRSFTEVHGPQGMGYYRPPSSPAQVENFAELIPILQRHAEELVIVAAGRLTSLAVLYTVYGDLMGRVGRLFVMGGAFLVPGNVTPVAEANFYSDPLAADAVMRQARSLILIPLNVTDRALLTPEMAAELAAHDRTGLIKPMFDFYHRFYKSEIPKLQGAPMHDLLTVIAAVRERMIRCVSSPVWVETASGPARGQSIGDFRPNASLPADRPIHRLAVDFDAPAFRAELMTVLKSGV